ncbi:uncharacterized protein LOC132705302 [Cylas formicarius]|uniref:uncharacterized protein LOC132705302 n=1 Tax=Cylas formicarius TaxID=197179 RepID=UPI002958B191|nr:uncharacterized protein LOC132705302 [Cylas formicarius]
MTGARCILALLAAAALWCFCCSVKTDNVYLQLVKSKLYLDKDANLVKNKDQATTFTFDQYGPRSENIVKIVSKAGKYLEVKGGCGNKDIALGEVKKDAVEQLFFIDDESPNDTMASSCDKNLVVGPDENHKKLILREVGSDLEEVKFITDPLY